MNQADLLRHALNGCKLADQKVLSLLSTLTTKDVKEIFHNNPVFYDGITKPDDRETQECFDQDRYDACMKALNSAHQHLLDARRILQGLGLDHVRFQVGGKVPQDMD